MNLLEFDSYLVTLFGAFTMQFLTGGTVGGHRGIRILKLIFPKKSDEFYELLNFWIVTLIGSLIGYLFYSPSTSLEALASGFGWTGAIKALTEGKSVAPTKSTMTGDDTDE